MRAIRGERVPLARWEYIKHYAGQEPKKAMKAIMAVLNEVEEVLRRIFEVAGVAT
ncbi:hypothetical protein V3F56_12385 [Moorellaceae bacterium AZ2]